MKASDLLTPSGAAGPAIGSTPVETDAPHAAIVSSNEESFVDEVPARPEPVRIDSGSQMVAFGSLLETPAEDREEDIGFLPPAHPELATERDWRDPDLEEMDEEAEEEKPDAPWRREEADSYTDAGSTSGAKDWRSGSFEQILARKAKGESWEPTDEQPELVEAAPAASNLMTETPVPASIPEAIELTRVISTTPFAVDTWATAASPVSQENSATETVTAVEEVKERGPSSAEPVVATVPEVQPVEPETKTSKESWFSVPSNPWSAEMEKANRLASAWDAAVPVAALPASSNGAEKAAGAASETTQKALEEAALPAAAVEAVREEAASVAEGARLTAEEQAASENSYARQEAAEAAASKNNTDDLVAKVLARMSPEVLQAVTREILKPVVEAMVKEEMKLKKS
ncbi:MAG: hypothetical protein DMG55_31035 [Acidobacteria bacterium]|nr:MAG: hypothetical protein DMG55_31035 [Acidobacteriota bacterium]